MISKKELLDKMTEIQQKGYRVHQWNEVMSWAESLPDDQPDVLPFQWPIPDGLEVVTWDGRKVGQLVMMDGITDPLLGVVDGVLHRWDKSGSMGNIHVGNDLFLRRKEKKVWVVEWDNGYTAHSKYPSFGEHNGIKAIYEAILKLIYQQSIK